MSLVLLVIVVAAVAYRAGRWSALAITSAVGVVAGTVIAATGGSLHDTPLPFVVVVATIASACALAVRRHTTSTA